MREWLKNLVSRAGHEMYSELKQMAAHGSHESAACLFNGSAFVMYPRGSHDDRQTDKQIDNVERGPTPQIEREM